MEKVIGTFEQRRFNIFNAHVSAKIFKEPDNDSSYHDSDVNQQIIVDLSEDVEQ